MTVRDVAIVGRHNRYGLSRDAGILRQALECLGIQAVALDKRKRSWMDRLRRRMVADLVVHLERVHPGLVGGGAPPRSDSQPGALPKASPRKAPAGRPCAGEDAARAGDICQAWWASVCLGFTSPDRYDPPVPRDWKRFFHLAGGSTLKGTEDILVLWAAHPEWPELVLVQKQANAPESVPSNVKLHCDYLDDDALKQLQNACGVHLCPSRSEGWGHNIVEAMSCGAVVVTTDAPPMNEHVTADCGVLVPASRSEPRRLGRNFFVDPSALETTVAQLVTASPDAAQSLGIKARERFEETEPGLRHPTVCGVR